MTILLLLTACAPTPRDPDTGATADPDTDAPPLVEICDRPGDEDRDGLADCEDSDCIAVCTETVCDDGVDDDDDGTVDCGDPDCWGSDTCSGEQLTLYSLGSASRSASRYSNRWVCDTGSRNTTSILQIMTLRNVTGVLREISPDGAGVSCSFEGDLVLDQEALRQSGVFVSSSVEITGFPTASSGCAIAERVPALLEQAALVPTAQGRIVDRHGRAWLTPTAPFDAWTVPASGYYESSVGSCTRTLELGAATMDIFPMTVEPDATIFVPTP